MAEYVNVAVDAMGGDNAPAEIVKGAVEAVNADKRVKVFLVGKEPVIREELKAYSYDAEQLEVVHAEEVIETAEPPVMAIRRKKDSSIVKAMYMVKNGECDAFVSAGSTGAVLVGGQVIVGRIRGVERPPLAPLIPTEKGVSSALLHQVKQGMMSTLRSKMGALLVKPALKTTLKSFDTSQYGGAPLLGLNGLVVKTHGSSKAVEVKNSILQCIAFKEEKINEKIKEQISLEDKAAENN